MEADAEGNQVGNLQGGTRGAALAAAGGQEHAEGEQGRKGDQRHTLPEGGQVGGEFERVEPCADGEIEQQTDGQAQDEVHHRTPRAAEQRIPEHAQHDRHDTHVEAEETKTRKEGE